MSSTKRASRPASPQALSPAPQTSDSLDIPGPASMLPAASLGIPEATIDAAAEQQPRSARVKFTSVVLVCAQCEQRKSGPAKLRSKDARKALKQNLGGARHRTRIVEVSCLGLCPKKSMAIAAIGPGAPMRAVEARKVSDVEAFAADFGRAMS